MAWVGVEVGVEVGVGVGVVVVVVVWVGVWVVVWVGVEVVVEVEVGVVIVNNHMRYKENEMLPTVKAIMDHDSDGIRVHITNLESGKEAIYRVDKILPIGNNVLYRVDKKPTTRQHRIIEGDPESWITNNIELLSKSVM